MGRKKAPHYRIVVAESTMPRDGRFVATIGHYNPTNNPAVLVVDREKALAWLGKGAMPTDTVESLFKKAGVYQAAPEGGVVAAVTGAATAAASAVAGAASAVAGAVKGAASAVAERVGGGEETPAEEAPAEEPAQPAAE